VRESTFSTIKQVKNEYRNRMADETLVDSHRLATRNIGIDIHGISGVARGAGAHGPGRHLLGGDALLIKFLFLEGV